MVKASTLQLRGAQHFRQRLVLSTLSGTAVRIEDIRADDTSPGLRNYEVSFLRLMEKVSDGCVVEINETGINVLRPFPFVNNVLFTRITNCTIMGE
jgi:RNA 3'-terminal phosphate cyclase-like protein